MADDIRVTSPVTIQSDGKSRVAFDMMQFIAAYDGNNANRDREYWLTLYSQCYKAAGGSTMRYIMDVKE